jgi:PAS domain S-box-containing protein
MSAKFNPLAVESEIIAAHKEFMERYHTHRDLDAVVELFSPQITNIGSGNDEVTLNHESVVDIFRRDMEQCPCPLEYEEKFVHVNVFNQHQGLLIAQFDSQGIIKEIPFTTKDFRISILWEKKSEKWLIRHIHLSKGEPTLQKGESFPLTEIEEKNQTLEKLVKQRTRDLCKLNIELSEANKDISEIKQRFETIFEKASDGIIVADWKNHSFFMVNQRICNILGYSKTEMADFWLNDIIPAKSIDESLEKILQESNGDRIMAEDIPLICKNKEVKYFDITSQQVKIKRKSYIVSLYRDITDYKKTIQQKQQAEISQKAANAKNLFLANLSHEIRTPFTGIISVSELLAKTTLSNQQAQYLEIIRGSSKVLLSMINDMLDVTKMESGKLTIKKSSFSLNELVKNMQTLTYVGLQEKNNKLKIELSPEISEYIEGDQMRIEQILINLLNNAIKFTQNGLIHVRIEKADSHANNLIKITVTDTGIGISETDQQRLFQKFHPLDSSLSRSYDGSGLGLYICKQLATLMGGQIGLTSKPDEGSSFWFTFSCNTCFKKKRENNIDEINEFFFETPLNLKVLLVDDKKVNLQVISLMLETAGCEVDTAINGLEALEKYIPDKHELVLMDIMMPLMDGITAMKELKKKYADMVPIIAITANAGIADKDKYIKEGFDAYIPKPLTMQNLTHELQELGLVNREELG